MVSAFSPGPTLTFYCPSVAIDVVMSAKHLAPGEVHRAGKQIARIGGKGIVAARAARCLGFASAVFTFLAGAGGVYFSQLADNENLDIRPAWVQGETRTTFVVHESSAGRTTVMNGPSSLAPAAEQVAAVEAALQARLVEGSVLVVSGSIPDALPGDHLVQLIQRAHDAGAVCIVDSTGRGLDAALEGRADIVRLNRQEAEDAITRYGAIESDRLPSSGECLASGLVDLGAQSAIVGVGDAGSWVAGPHGARRVPTAVAKPLLSFGAGDSFVAGLATQLLRGANLLDATRWGNASASAALSTGIPGVLLPGVVRERHESIQTRMGPP